MLDTRAAVMPVVRLEHGLVGNRRNRDRQSHHPSRSIDCFLASANGTRGSSQYAAVSVLSFLTLCPLFEQDHRNIKSRTKVVLGFKRFRGAATTISGIELTHRIRKGRFNLTTLDLKDTATPAQ
jgi:hypothetical protein